MHVGERIREARSARGLSAEQLAVAIGRGSMTVFRWEWGETSPKFSDIERVAKALDVPVSDLTEGHPAHADTLPPTG